MLMKYLLVALIASASCHAESLADTCLTKAKEAPTELQVEYYRQCVADGPQVSHSRKVWGALFQGMGQGAMRAASTPRPDRICVSKYGNCY